ncbi:hypothetical protein D8B26_000968 [Coccidioides posadasii str. Silveira]|nr:hypothetical protein D8B26_000968 [Coccidioides posadasii str. Silveira]
MCCQARTMLGGCDFASFVGAKSTDHEGEGQITGDREMNSQICHACDKVPDENSPRPNWKTQGRKLRRCPKLYTSDNPKGLEVLCQARWGGVKYKLYQDGDVSACDDNVEVPQRVKLE